MAKITRSRQPGSSAGATPTGKGSTRAGAKATNPTPGPRYRSGSRAVTLTCSRFGLVKEIANETCAYLDFDRRAIPRLRPILAVCRLVGLRPVWVRMDRTTHGWHVIVRFRDRLLRSEIVAFQACCKSDYRREALNLMRVIAIRRSPVTDPFWLKRRNLLYHGKLR